MQREQGVAGRGTHRHPDRTDLSSSLSDIGSGLGIGDQVLAIQRLAAAAESHGADAHCGAHVRRISRYCRLLAVRCGEGTDRAELFYVASSMHDVGMIGVPDQVRLKPGTLEPEEFETMMSHTELGYEILEQDSSELMTLAARIAHTHHERVDGSGYPHGLSGAAIPLEGRITAIADMFDALTSERLYRPAFQIDQAVEIMEQSRATHLDADLFDLFCNSLDEVLAIRSESPPTD